MDGPYNANMNRTLLVEKWGCEVEDLLPTFLVCLGLGRWSWRLMRLSCNTDVLSWFPSLTKAYGNNEFNAIIIFTGRAYTWNRFNCAFVTEVIPLLAFIAKIQVW